MKKVILSCLLAAGLHGAAQAQSSNVSLGLKAGASYATLEGPQSGNPGGRFGFQAGGFANIGLTDLFAFQPEILYSQKGAKFTNLVANVGPRFNYLDVPLVFHVNVDGLFFEAGPQVGFLLSAKQYDGNTATDIKPTTNAVDFGYVAGLGYQRKRGLGIGLRYNGGLANTPKEQTSGNATVQDKAHNSVFQLYLTYSFNGR